MMPVTMIVDWPAANDHLDAAARRWRIRVVAHRQRGDLEPEGAIDARDARSERVARREPTVAADVLDHTVRRVAGPAADAEADERSFGREIATEQLAGDTDRVAPSDSAR